MKKFAMLCLLALFSANAFGHGENRVEIESDLVTTKAGRIVYKFQLVDDETESLLGSDDLSISHEQKLHLIAYDPSLNEFQHVHPTFDGEFWNVELSFAVNGSYWIWMQGVLASDGDEFNAGTRLLVTDGSSEMPAPPQLGDKRSNRSGTSIATLSSQRLRAGQHAMLSITISRSDGSQPQLSPYLGAFAHVIGVPTSGDSLLHVHPSSTNKPDQGMLHVTFPKAGFYRLWAQFIDGGELKTIPLSVQVF